MEWIRQWLLGVVAAALMAALADGMMPKGAVRRVGRLVCAMMILCAVLRPVLRVPVPSGRLMEDVERELSRSRGELEQSNSDLLKTLIEQESAAYIVDKAAELGVACEARVECVAGEGDLWLPFRARVSGQMNAEQRRALTEQIESALGISSECVVFAGGE